MRKIILLFLFAICLHAKEPVKIIKILDTNLFVTDSGDTLSMAFIETMSIHNEDELKHQIAKETIDFLKKTFKHYKIFFEYDSTVNKVELYKKYPLGFESINLLLLKNGLSTIADSTHVSPLYLQAEKNAKNNQAGIHKILNPREKIYYNHAWWMNAGIGLGVVKFKKYNNTRTVLEIESGLTIRHRHWIMSGNYIHAIDESTHHKTWAGGLGYSLHQKHTEIAVSIGPSLYQYKYDIEYHEPREDRPQYFQSDWQPGIAIRAQSLVYFAQFAGMGIDFTLNFTDERNLYFLTFNLILGGWWN